ncbi:MAG TPA: cupin domain-containing protein [Allosphingosinicella sp.]|nr:cupin domain-containing protein [Allosphingosinicella sp.]
MQVVNIKDLPLLELPGATHRTLAGATNGVKQGEVWLQTIDPGQSTPMHQHDCEEVVVVVSGRGVCVCGDERIEFGPGSIVTLKPNEVHQLSSIGDEPLTGYGFFTMGPVIVEAPGGGHMPMPWDQPPQD